MKKSYYLADAKQIETFLGANSTVEVTKRGEKSYGSGTLFKKMRARRVDEFLVEVSVRDYDGSRFQFLVNPETELGQLISPCFDGSSLESMLLRQLWFSASDMLRKRRK